MRHLLTAGVLGLSLLAGSVVAAEEPIGADTDVVIREQGDQTITEYRMNGVTYAIRVKKGDAPAYYLIKADGDQFIHTDGSEKLIPAWKIFEWQ